MTRARLALGLLLVVALPLLLSFPAVEPLDRVSRSAAAIGALLLVCTAPGGRTGPVAWWQGAAVLAPPLALAVALDGAATEAALAFVVAALGARAVERARPAAWSVAWWLVFFAPCAVALAFGRASAPTGVGGAALALSPFELAARANAGASGPVWVGAATGAVAALLVPALAPRVGAARRGTPT